MSDERRSVEESPAPEPELAPKPDERAGLYLMVGFAALLALVIVLGWLTNPS